MKAGTTIGGKYRLVRLLGEGGMGVVWAAVNELTEREVALKLIRGLEAANEDARKRLLREARACGRIVHRNVVQIYDVGETDAGDPFLVMEMLNGSTVAELLQRERRLAPEVALRIAAETARGLRAAHAARVIHRDLKPSNLFLHEEPGAEAPVLKILDFGVSKTLQQDSSFTATGKTMGSPAYMSPEQVRGLKTVDHRTDLWSLGTVLAEMVSGKRVFQGQTPYGAAAEVISGKIRTLSDLMPGADARIGAIVDKCLQRDLAKRFASADELLDAIGALLGEERSVRIPSIPAPAAPAPVLASMRPAPLPVIENTDSIDSIDEPRITPTEFAPPPVMEDAPPLVLSEDRDTVRPKPPTLPPTGSHGLPVVNRDSAVDSEEITRAEENPLGARVAAESGVTPPQLVLWDDYVKARAKEGDPGTSRPIDALADPDAPASPPLARVLVVVTLVAIVAGVLTFFLLGR
ncbi:serine/threonine-protein kinase [Polyangium aurulentum]|uniref:serine/threonine-protein kinase n=1 Tax=Polyangium aurulentum TaxID=2567896 RepID=UPI0010AE10E1|nr:serine/threonine-protein kinase [Polyangium aurulentum]UQA56103.1 serine/threonine protein kinase [Polyangium aurulentum]